MRVDAARLRSRLCSSDWGAAAHVVSPRGLRPHGRERTRPITTPAPSELCDASFDWAPRLAAGLPPAA